MSEIVSSVVGKFCESLVEPVSRTIGYMTHSQKNVSVLIEQMERLVDTRARVQQAVETAERNAEEIERNVVRWLMQADESIDLMERFLMEERIRSWRRMNLRERYLMSRKAKKMESDAVELLIERGKFKEVSIKDSLAVEDPYYYLTDSNAEIIKDIKAALKDENVKRIGVYGMGGVGKSRLVQNVCIQLKEEGVFDEVVWAVGGPTADYRKTRAKIADGIGLDLERLQGREGLLSWQMNDIIDERLTMRGDILIILDDVWEFLDLYDLGIQRMHRCKIIFTCIDEYRLREMGIERMWEVEILSNVESWQLFKSVVGDAVVESPVLNPLAKEVAHKCGGLPLAIIVAAKALRGKSGYSNWSETVKQLKDNSIVNTRGMLEKAYSSMQLGFNYLESEEAKSMFLLCSLFPESFDIPMDHVMYYCLGLQLFNNIGGKLMKARDKVHTLVENLKASALLMDDAGHDHIRMHSIVRRAALDISLGRDFQIYSPETSDSVVRPRRYSTHDESAIWSYFEEFFHEGTRFPYLKLLTLKCNRRYSSLCYLPTHFFVGMKMLNVLHLIELNDLSLPLSISVLVNLRTLLIEYCMLERGEGKEKKGGDHLSILGTLSNLEILSFYGSDIKELPIEMEQLTELRILNLSNCLKLIKIPPYVISRLSKLEGLYMKNSVLSWEIARYGNYIINNLSIDELTSLSSLTELEISILDARYLTKYDILLTALHRFYISIGPDNFSWENFYPSSRTLKITGDCVNDTINVLLKKAEAIYLKGLPSYFGEVEHESYGDIFSNCRYLEIRDCVGIEDLINFRKSQLQKNVLRDHGIFHNMESLQVIDCSLEFLFLETLPRFLVLLKELKITRSRNIEYIVRCESSEEVAIDVIVFPKLRSLTLEFLPRLISFSSKRSAFEASDGRRFLFNHMVEFPSLEELSIHGLDQMEVIFDNQIPSNFFPKLRSIMVVNRYEIPRIENTKVGDISSNLKQLTFMSTSHLSEYSEYDHLRALSALYALTLWGNSKLMLSFIDMDSFVHKFPMDNLTDLQLWNCNTLQYIFSPSTAKGFSRLQTLRIESCSIVQVIANGGQEALDDTLLFPNLISLILNDLPNLTAFSTINFNSNLGWLGTLIIAHCPRMKAFVVKLSTTDQGLDKTDEVQGAQSSFFGDQVAFPRLATLKLSDIDSIKHFSNEDTPKIGESEIDYMKYPLRSLFSSYVAGHLLELKVLEVVECMVEEIVAWDEDANNVIDFAQVHSLKLKDFPNLVSFYRGNQSLTWLSLTTLEVERCPNLEMLSSAFLNSPEKEKEVGYTTRQMTISSPSTRDLIKQEFMISSLSLHHLVNLKEIWKDCYRILVFNDLSCMTIHGCENLKTLFSPAIIQCLPELQVLIVDSSKMIEDVISKESSSSSRTGNDIILRRLKSIELKNLPKLESFLSGEYKLSLPILNNVRVEECPKLQTFSPRQVYAPNLNGVQIGDSQWEWKGDLESTIGHLFNGEVQFSEIEELRVNGPDKLIDILETKLHYTAFRRLKLLHIERCDEELRDFLSKLLFRFQELKKLHVENCSALEQLFNLEWFYFEDGDKIFVKLEELKLRNLLRLICIWNEEMSGYVTLKNLKRVDICGCGRLVNLFSPSMARDLQQLQELKIRDCDMMKEVIAAETERNFFGFKEICLPRLQHLELIGLSNLMTFHSGHCSFKWPCLHTLSIERCARLKSLVPGFVSYPLYGMRDETQKYKLVGFPRLNQLCLKSLNDFEEILQESITEESFTELQILEVDDCGKLLNTIPHDVLPRLKKLEKLTIKNCPSLRKVFDLESQIINEKQVGSDEFTQLNESISFNPPDSVPDGLIAVFENLQVLKLSDSYRLNNLFSTAIARPFSELKDLQNPTSPEIIEEQIKQGKETVKIDYELLPKLSFLDLDLSSLTMEKCPDLKIFFPAPGQPLFGQVFTFERLEELHLVHLGYFEQIWHDKLPIRSLHRLRVLSVEKGERLLKIVPSHTLMNLLELEKLYIQNCDSLKQIFDLDEIMASITGELFPQLTFLVLTHLPEMVAIFSKQPIGIPVFSNLRSLRIIHCNSLSSLFSASTARGLQQLQEFKVFGCNKMQVVIVDDDKDTKEHMIFPKLRCLVLKHLSQLTSFYRGENTIKWLVLDEVRIKSVPVMETFAFGSQETPQLTTIYVTFLEKCWKRDLNETIQFLHKNKKWNAATEMVVHEYEATSSREEIQTISQPYATTDPVKHFPSALKINGSMIVEPGKDKGKEIMQDP